MGKNELNELYGRKKAQIIKLIEVADVTRQVAEAVDRGDSVSAQLLLGEREAPVRELSELDEGIREYLQGCPERDAIRLNELLHGAEPESEEEKPFAEQVAQFRRLLASVRAMDEQVSVRLGGKQSFYKKYR